MKIIPILFILAKNIIYFWVCQRFLVISYMCHEKEKAETCYSKIIKWHCSFLKKRIPNINTCKHFSGALKFLLRGIISHSASCFGDISLATSTMEAG